MSTQTEFLSQGGAAILPAYQKHSATSKAAASAMRPNAATLREKVFALIRYSGAYGKTDLEIQQGLDMEGSTERPRRIELMRAGRIRQDGTRPTPSGRKAAVWVAQ